jgi:hypothetical protein
VPGAQERPEDAGEVRDQVGGRVAGRPRRPADGVGRRADRGPARVGGAERRGERVDGSLEIGRGLHRVRDGGRGRPAPAARPQFVGIVSI